MTMLARRNGRHTAHLVRIRVRLGLRVRRRRRRRRRHRLRLRLRLRRRPRLGLRLREYCSPKRPDIAPRSVAEAQSSPPTLRQRT